MTDLHERLRDSEAALEAQQAAAQAAQAAAVAAAAAAPAELSVSGKKQEVAQGVGSCSERCLLANNTIN